jgi:hypothetical protein
LTYTTQGDHVVTWSYVDARGNFSLQSQTVRVKDTLAPVPSVASLPDVVGQCSATISAPPTATDNCAGVVTGTTTSPLTYSAQGDYAVVWTYSDGHGQAVTQTQMVRVHDTLAPVPNVASLPTISGSGSVTVTTVPKATDNCSGTVNGTTQSLLTYTTPGTYTITWRYVDAAGNLTTQTQTVVVTSATTATTLTYGGATSATAGGTVALKATLKTSSGTLLAGQTVKFVLGSQTVSAVTTSKGIASASLVLNQAAGSYTVQSSFAGTATYGASSTTTPFTINPKRR